MLLHQVTKVAHLSLHRLHQPDSSTPVLVVGNAYGVLPYQVRLASEFASQGYDVYWFPFSGQDGTAGTFGVAQGVEDLGVILSHLDSALPATGIHVVAHCAGSLITTEYLQGSGSSQIRSLSIYGILYAPWRRRRIAERRLRNAGVLFDLSHNDWYYPWKSRLSSLAVPTQLFHANDELNLDRANKIEIEEACVALNSACVWFDRGYDTEYENIRSFRMAYELHIQNQEPS